jgi:putative phosphoesterase
MSDSHGNLEAVQRALLCMGEVAVILHAGDLYQDAVWLKRQGYRAIGVAGNCDHLAIAPRERRLKISGRRVWLVHGHRHDVKSGYRSLIEQARQRKAHVVVFGHTHYPVVFHDHDMCFLNPGSVDSGRGSGPSYGILEISAGQVSAYTCQIVD